MTRFILRRLFTALVTLLISSFLVCMLIHLIPGDPVVMMMAQNSSPTPEQLAAMRHMLGLDLPIWLQYFHYMGRLLHGDLGRSIFGSDPVLTVLLERLPNTFALAFAGLAIAVGLGLPLGFFAAYHKGSWADSALMLFAVAGVSVPNFWLGLMLVLLFSTTLELAARRGRGLEQHDPAGDHARRDLHGDHRPHDALLDDRGVQRGFHPDRASQRPAGNARDVSPRAEAGDDRRRHDHRGRVRLSDGRRGRRRERIQLERARAMAIQAINYRDYPLIQGFILLFATIVVTVSVLLDIAYAWLDPRISVT